MSNMLINTFKKRANYRVWLPFEEMQVLTYMREQKENGYEVEVKKHFKTYCN